MNLLQLIDAAWDGDAPEPVDLDLVGLHVTGDAHVVVRQPNREQAFAPLGGSQRVWSSWVRDPAEWGEVEIVWEGYEQFGFETGAGVMYWSSAIEDRY